MARERMMDGAGDLGEIEFIGSLQENGFIGERMRAANWTVTPFPSINAPESRELLGWKNGAIAHKIRFCAGGR
jgi:hypothetical protein